MDKSKLLYTNDHEWVEKIDDYSVRIGITDYAVEQLGDIVYVELPELDESYDLEEEIASIESVKSTSGIFAPIAGTVTEVNEGLEDSPETVNEDSYEAGWLCVMKSDTELDLSDLLSLEAYEELIEE